MQCVHQTWNTDTKFMLVGDYFVTDDNRKHRIKQHLTCNSDWAIYMLICINCGMYSFGSTTTTVNKRFSSHKSCIINNTNARDYPMVKHFNTPTNKWRKVADSRLNGLEIHKQGISLSFLSGNSRLDFDNRSDNRRNYSEKHRSGDEIIKFHRPHNKANTIRQMGIE
eukprot:683469_1